MNDSQTDLFAERLRDLAEEFPYPPTPDIAGAVRRPRGRTRPARRAAWRWAAALLLLCALALLLISAVPPARAALLRFLTIGAVRINLLEETPAAPAAPAQPVSILDVGRPLSLAEAGELITLRQPPYPPALGPADAIYGQNLLYREPVISFLWQPAAGRPQILLTQIAIPQFGAKWAAGDQLQETEINGRPAYWIEGPHLFNLDNAQIDQGRLIAANVLIWTAGGSTFRLESDLALAEARRIAESWD